MRCNTDRNNECQIRKYRCLHTHNIPQHKTNSTRCGQTYQTRLLGIPECLLARWMVKPISKGCSGFYIGVPEKTTQLAVGSDTTSDTANYPLRTDVLPSSGGGRHRRSWGCNIGVISLDYVPRSALDMKKKTANTKR